MAPEYTIQLVTRELPFRIGFAPLPYAPKVMTLPDVPDEGTTNCSRQVQPRLKRMESPGEKVWELTLAIVSHGVDVLVPLFESLPLQST
jgi:hypothetical protein